MYVQCATCPRMTCSCLIVSGVVVCGSCFDIINLACREGFPYENLFSGAILFSHPKHISTSNAQKVLILFWHIFCLCAGSNHRNWLRICQTRDLYIRIHNLKLPCSRKFIGRRFMCPKVGVHEWKLRNFIIFVEFRNREICFRNDVSGLQFIEISMKSLRCAQCFSL